MIWLVASMLTLPLAPKSTSTRCALSAPSEVPGPSTLPRSPRLSLVPASSMSQTQAAPMDQPRAWTCAAEERMVQAGQQDIEGDRRRSHKAACNSSGLLSISRDLAEIGPLRLLHQLL